MITLNRRRRKINKIYKEEIKTLDETITRILNNENINTKKEQ